MARVTVDPKYCKGCGLCIHVCPKKVLKFSDKINAKGYYYSECINQEGCIACKMCYTICPDTAIKIEK